MLWYCVESPEEEHASVTRIWHALPLRAARTGRLRVAASRYVRQSARYWCAGRCVPGARVRVRARARAACSVAEGSRWCGGGSTRVCMRRVVWVGACAQVWS